MAKTDYLVKYHELYFQRIQELKSRVRELKGKLTPDEFARHEAVKLAVRIREAEKEIEGDPDRPEYRLHDELRKFRRYKRGLGRYRIIFCFSSKPPIIIFLYLNTADTLRKAGSRLDPYERFKAMLRRGEVSHAPDDPKTKKWIVSREDERATPAIVAAGKEGNRCSSQNETLNAFPRTKWLSLSGEPQKICRPIFA